VGGPKQVSPAEFPGLIRGCLVNMVLFWIMFSLVLVGGGVILIRWQKWDWRAWPVRVAALVANERILIWDEVFRQGQSAGRFDVVKKMRLDTDGDGEEEWLMFYRYDKAGGSALAAVIYDVRGLPPVIYPYPLRQPDRDYLAESYNIKAAMKEAIKENLGDELVIQDGNRQVTIFRWVDELSPEEQPHEGPQQGYQCLGYFRGSEKAYVDPDTGWAVTLDRAAYERSQFVIRRAYKPKNGTYMEGNRLLPPEEISIDFPGEQVPSDILETPYPEKIVLAFYKTFYQNTYAEAQSHKYLTDEAVKRFKLGDYTCPGAPIPHRILVKSISYQPSLENQPVVSLAGFYEPGAEVSVKLDCISTDLITKQPVHWSGERTWTLVWRDNRWLLD